MLESSGVPGLWASIGLFHLKADAVSISERLESDHTDARIVNKYVPTSVLSDEAVSLIIPEPLYDPFCQDIDLLANI